MPITPITDIECEKNSYGQKSWYNSIKKNISKHLNPLIKKYNNLDFEKDGKYAVELLNNIALKQKELNQNHTHTYSILEEKIKKNLTRSIDYHNKINIILTKELQQEYKKFPQYFNNSDFFPLVEILKNMPPENLDIIGKILQNNSKNISEELSKKFPQYDKFWDSHEITFIGGGHSKNFLVRDLSNNTALVLKIEDRLGQSKYIESYLRANGLEDIFLPIYFEHYITFEKENYLTSKVLVVTDYCENKNLLSYHSKQPDYYSRLHDCINLFIKMCKILIRIANAGCVFVDMKNSNWLLDAQENFHISDTKSFKFIKKKCNKNITCGFIYNYGLWAPEFGKQKFYANTMTFLLAKNIFQYLTNCRYGDLPEINTKIPIYKKSKIKIENNIFELLEKMLSSDPKDRLSLEDTLLELKTIKQEILFKKALQELTNSKNSFKFLQDKLEDSLCSNKHIPTLHR